MSFWHLTHDPFDRLLEDRLEQTACACGAHPMASGLRRCPVVHTRPLGGPRMDIFENTKDNTIEATFELPGLKKDEVDINISNDRLTVSGESKIPSGRKETDYAVRERRCGKFSRTLQLPPGLEAKDIKANMEHGVLTVTFPNASAEAAPQKITVS